MDKNEKLIGPTYQYFAEMDPQFDNFPIKGFTIDKAISGSLKLADGAESLSLTECKSKAINLELSGADDGIDPDDLTIERNNAPGAEEIIGVTLSDGKQGGDDHCAEAR